MSAVIVIEKYAHSLFEIAAAANTVSKTMQELDVVAIAFSDKSIIDFFKSPFNSQDNKTAAAKCSLEGKVSAEVFNFVATLVVNKRMHLIAEINAVFKLKASQVGGHAEGTLYVVSEPSAEFKMDLEKKVSVVLKKQVKLKIQTDKSLISGFKVQVDGWTLDYSAAHHLKKLTENLSKRGL